MDGKWRKGCIPCWWCWGVNIASWHPLSSSECQVYLASACENIHFTWDTKGGKQLAGSCLCGCIGILVSSCQLVCHALASHWVCGKDFHLCFPNVTTLFWDWLFDSCTAYLKIDAIPGVSMSRILIGLTAIKHSLWTLRWKSAISFLLPEMFGFLVSFFFFSNFSFFQCNLYRMP